MVSLLENSFAASFEPRSGAESPAYWRFALGSGPPLGLAVAFSNAPVVTFGISQEIPAFQLLHARWSGLWLTFWVDRTRRA